MKTLCLSNLHRHWNSRGKHSFLQGQGCKDQIACRNLFSHKIFLFPKAPCAPHKIFIFIFFNVVIMFISLWVLTSITTHKCNYDQKKNIAQKISVLCFGCKQSESVTVSLFCDILQAGACPGGTWSNWHGVLKQEALKDGQCVKMIEAWSIYRD